jgi:hypothetical protein
MQSDLTYNLKNNKVILPQYAILVKEFACLNGVMFFAHIGYPLQKLRIFGTKQNLYPSFKRVKKEKICMKKSFLKALSLLAVLGLMAVMTACAEENAGDANPNYSGAGLLNMEDEPEYPQDEFEDWNMNMTEFMSFSGTVIEINPFYGFQNDEGVSLEDQFFVLVQSEEDENGYSPTVNFVVDHLSALILDGELEVGMDVTGFYETGVAMIMIYPPQHNVRVLASDPNVIVERFGETLEIGEDTEIIFQDGTPFDGEPSELLNRAMAVFGGIESPEKIVVLFERAVPPMHWFTEDEIIDFGLEYEFEQPYFGWDGGLQLTQEDLDIMWDNMFDPETVQIIVNNTAIESVKPFIDREVGKVMLPVAAIAEALGYTITGEGYDMAIGMYGAAPHTIVFVEGQDAYLIGRFETISLGAPPALIDETLFVPMNFFGQVIEASAWISCGDVIISNVDGDDMR